MARLGTVQLLEKLKIKTNWNRLSFLLALAVRCHSCTSHVCPRPFSASQLGSIIAYVELLFLSLKGRFPFSPKLALEQLLSRRCLQNPSSVVCGVALVTSNPRDYCYRFQPKALQEKKSAYVSPLRKARRKPGQGSWKIFPEKYSYCSSETTHPNGGRTDFSPDKSIS